jgi:hypothetical protein
VLDVAVHFRLKCLNRAQVNRFHPYRGERISILNVMDEDDPIDEISRIEAELERRDELSQRKD